MKTKTLLIAGACLFLSATALVLNPAAPATVDAGKQINLPTSSARRETNHPPANPTVSQQHLGAPLEKHADRENATAATADTLAAETQYAEAAPDPASRIALLWLDREREVRAEAARACRSNRAITSHGRTRNLV